MSARADPLATITDFQSLHSALRQRADAMQLSRAALDALTGLADGYCSTILAPTPIKKFGMKSLGPLLRVLGVRLLLVEDPEALAELERRAPMKRSEAQVRHRSEQHAE